MQTGTTGVINDYYLVKTASFEPRGSLGHDGLRGENITDLRWWTRRELYAHGGSAVFAPRQLPMQLADLIAGGVPDEPLSLGL